MREGFVFYRSFYEAMNELDDKSKCEIIKAICEYQFNGVEVSLSGTNKAIWTLIKPQLDANNERYENGKKGGAPVGNANAKKQPKTTKTTIGCFEKQPKQPTVDLENNQKQPKEKEKEKEKVNVKENEKEAEAEKENLDLLLPPPTLSQVESYVKEKKLKCDAKRFFDYYEASDWVDNDGNSISNWKQKLLNWDKNEKVSKESDDIRKVRSADVIDFDKYYWTGE